MNQLQILQSKSKVANKLTIVIGLTGLLIIFIFILLGIWLEEARQVSGLIKKYAHTIEVFFELFTHIGIAFFIAALFSFFIEFKDFTEYVERLLTRIVMDQEYLRKLSNEERINLRRDVDLATLRVESSLGRASEFYEFLTSVFDKVIKNCYRTNYEECYKYYVEDDHLTRKRTIKYFLFKGFQHDHLKITWQWGGKESPNLDVNEIYNYIKNIELNIESKSLNMDVSYKYCAQEKILAKANKNNKDLMPDTINIEAKQTEGRIFIGFSFEIPGSDNLKLDDFIKVNIIDDLQILDDDPVVIARMAYPTQSPSFHFSFPEGYLVRGLQPFKILTASSKGYQISPMGKNETHIIFDEWILPGHGVAVYYRETVHSIRTCNIACENNDRSNNNSAK